MNNIELCLEELGFTVVPITGTSMLPLLREGKSQVELERVESKPLKKGDVVLYKKSDGTLVLHRIINTESEDVLTVLGDHQWKNPDKINKGQVIAIGMGFYINGHYTDEKNLWYKIYKKIWMGSLTLRRIILAFLRLFGI